MKRLWRGLLAAALLLWGLEVVLYLAEPDVVRAVRSLTARGGGPRFDAAALGLVPAPDSTAGPVVRTPGTTRVAAVGHLRVLNYDPHLLSLLAGYLNRESPDLVILLGDYTVDGNLREWGRVDAFLKQLQAPVWATAGNHEHARSWAVSADSCAARFHRRFDYDHRMEVTGQANLILMDSNRPLAETAGRLADDFSRSAPGRPTVLFTHHKIWEDPEGDAWYDMPYRSSEILGLLRGRIFDVVSGDLPDDPARGAHAVSYRVTEVDGIRMHPVGLGDPGYGHPLVYGVGAIDDRGMVHVEVKVIPLQDGDPWYSVRVGDGGEAFRGLSLGGKLRLYLWYLRHARIPRGRVPLYHGT